MSKIITVKVYVIILYAIGVIVSCLLVGILPALVNKPECKINNIKLAKRDIKSESFGKCPEIGSDQIGPTPQWEYFRIPSNLIPQSYEINLNLLDNPNYYTGYSVINITLTEPTDLFIIHRKLNHVKIEQIIDSTGEQIQISCDGEFPKNDFYIFKTRDTIRSNFSTLKFYFNSSYDKYESGLFKFEFGSEKKTAIISKFEPLDARKVFPCFDEPNLKSSFKLTIHYSNDTRVLFNTPIEEESLNRTIFKATPRIPSYLLGLVVFNKQDFKFKTKRVNSKIDLNIWARSELVDMGYVDEPLEIAAKILDSILDLFCDVIDAAPNKIDIFASPSYPLDAVPHYGLPIFKESKILFKPGTVSESEIQKIALLIAKQFSEFWFGNYVTFRWWNELWLQEAMGDYFKYRVIENVFPEWNIYEQFITEELIQVLVQDAYPSSHPVYKDIKNPYEIEQYFDIVESSKAAAVLRMMEQEKGKEKFLEAIISYLEANGGGTGEASLFFSQLGKIRNWNAEEFANRWFKQSNYPVLFMRLDKSNNNRYYLNVEQTRSINNENSLFAGDVLYPSPYNWTWFIPLTCLFSNGTNLFEQSFDIETKKFEGILENESENIEWFYCNLKFLGYFDSNYDYNNWKLLENVLKTNHTILDSSDRSNLIHNLFVNSFNQRLSYDLLTDVLTYMINEEDYLTWKTLNYHLSEIVSLLEYKKSFYQVSSYFDYLLRNIELKKNLWNSTGDNHLEVMLKETVLDLACKLQDFYCLNNATSIWNENKIYLLDESLNKTIAGYLKQTVYNYHIQNTYLVDEWELLYFESRNLLDLREKILLIESLSYTRLPWFIQKYLLDLDDDVVNFFDKFKLLAKNNIGRELAWNYLREKYTDLLNEYGLDDVRLGQILIDLTYTFETNSLLYELVDFIISTPSGSTTEAKFKSMEKVSTNILWLKEREEEVIEAFGKPKLFN